MSPIPAVLEADSRATTPRGPSEESRLSPEARFQDAVDSRRAERAHTASKKEDLPDSHERVNEREGDSDGSDASRSDALEDSGAEAPADPTQAHRARSQDSSARPNDAAGQAAISEGTAPRKGIRVSHDAILTGSTERPSEADTTALPIPWFGQVVLEAVLARALPHGSLSGSSVVASGLAPASGSGGDASTHIAPQTSGLAEQAVAALKVSTAVASDTDALGGAAQSALQHDARDVASPNHVVDPRGPLAAFAAPQPTELAATQAPVTLRMTPAELPRLFERLAVHIDMPERSALVHLEPADLGPLRIALSVEPGGHVRAEMHAQRQDGYAALEACLPELHSSLIERGFTSASVNLSLGLPDPNSRRSGAQREEWKSTSAGRRTLADAEVRALLPASVGAIDMWA
jgi:flagellar hook-length control protein FliK